MPFYLVTHRSLVEADTDQDAAVKDLEKIEAGGKLSFEVKFDEDTVTQVVVTRERAIPKSGEMSKPPERREDAATSIVTAPGSPHSTDEGAQVAFVPELPGRPDRKTAIIVAIVLAGLCIFPMLFAW